MFLDMPFMYGIVAVVVGVALSLVVVECVDFVVSYGGESIVNVA